jgi:hypothetical protein
MIDKIAFVVHEPMLWEHYAGVWGKLPPDSFAIVLSERLRFPGSDRLARGVSRFLDRCRARNFETVWAGDLAAAGEIYRFAVSNHKIQGTSATSAPLARQMLSKLVHRAKKLANAVCSVVGATPRFPGNTSDPVQYLPLQIGKTQVRFMYGADVGDGWSLADWNGIYDAFLCHGPNDCEQVAKRFPGKTFAMGYPRYDEYFNPQLDASAERSEFRIDPNKKTVLWMPTYGDGACSIPSFARPLSTLAQRVNLIVRPHPISFDKKPDDIALLESLDYRIDRDPMRDMNKLYRLADYVLCDFGGSSFGGLYLKKRVVLLDVPGAHEWFSVRNSSNLDLAEYFPSLSSDRIEKLLELIDDEAQWTKIDAVVDSLRAKYFAPLEGRSAAKAAELLLQFRQAFPLTSIGSDASNLETAR